MWAGGDDVPVGIPRSRTQWFCGNRKCCCCRRRWSCCPRRGTSSRKVTIPDVDPCWWSWGCRVSAEPRSGSDVRGACLVCLSVRDAFSVPGWKADSATTWLRVCYRSHRPSRGMMKRWTLPPTESANWPTTSLRLPIVIIRWARLSPTEPAVVVLLRSGLLSYDTSRVIAWKRS